MNEIPPSDSTQPEPDSLTSEKASIRKSQEEFVGDQATPSMDKSEYEARRASGQGQPAEPGREPAGGQPAR